MNSYYDPEYYGASEVQGEPRDLYEGEVNVVENIQNERKNKASTVKVDENKFSPLNITPPRELRPEELDVVDNINDYKQNKENIVESEGLSDETVDEEVYHSEY